MARTQRSSSSGAENPQYKYAAAEGGTMGHKPMLRRAAASLY
jgi:hypothetical protein